MTAVAVPAAATAASAATPGARVVRASSSKASAHHAAPVHGLGLTLGAARTSASATLRATGLRAQAALPAAVDLRTTGFLPAVGDQGQIGSCATWSIAHTIMGYDAAKAGESGAPYNPLYLWQGQTGGANPNTGTTAVGDLSQAQSTGVDTEADYYQGWYGYQTPPTAAETANAAKYRITGYTVLWQGVSQAAGTKQQLLEQALAAGNPVAVDFSVHASFENLVNLTNETAQDPESGAVLGGHMVTAVGYDSTGLILRNQWGTTWGHGGDLKVTWGWVSSQVAEAYTVTGVTTPVDSGVRTADAPVVVRASTTSGSLAGGTSTTLTGSNLGAATAVTVGGRSAAFTPATSGGATSLVVTVPAGAAVGAAPIAVTNSGGTSAASPAAVFTYAAAPAPAPAAVPTVTAVNPGSVSTAGGAVVTLTGTNLTGATSVKVGGTAATGVKVLSATSLQLTAPAHAAGAASVVVTTAAGSSSGTTALTYAATVVTPVVTGLSPSSGPTYRATVTTVSGSGLAQATAVTVGGVSVPFARVSDTALQVSVPAGSAGAAAVVVTTPAGRSSGSVSFTRVAPSAPTITSVTTAVAGRASTVTVIGSGLGSTSAATVGSRSVGGTIYSDTQISMNVPALAAGTYPVVLRTQAGSVSATLVVS